MNRYLMRYTTIPTLMIGILTLLFTGCTNSLFTEEAIDKELLSVNLLVTPSESETILRANVDGTDEENKVECLTLLTFKDSGQLYEKKDITSNVIPANSPLNTIYKYQAKLPAARDYTFVVVANWEVPTDFSGSHDDLKRLIINSSTPTALPTSPFVMYGEKDVTNLTTNSNIEVEIARRVFAVDIQSSASDFTLGDEWYLYNGEAYGFLATDLTATETLQNSTLKNSGQLTKQQKAYSYPRFSNNISKDEETFVVFKGEYKGISSYYRVALNKIGTTQELQPNKLYRLKILKINGVGYNTLDDAVKGEANKSVVFTVSDWDKNNSETIFFDKYYIKADRVFFEFDAFLQQASTLVTTNAPGLDIIPSVDSDEAEKQNYIPALWTTLSLVPGFNNVEGQYMLNVGCYGNLEKNSRRSFGYVRAKGLHTDHLKMRIDVLQRTDEHYFGDALNIKVSPMELYSDSQKAPEKLLANVTVPLERQAWGIRDIQYFIPELSEYISVTDERFKEHEGDYGFIDTVKTPDGEAWTYNESIEKSIKWYNGNGKIIITTKSGMDARPRQARVILQAGRDKYLTTFVDIRQDFRGDYVITYPTSVANDMKRNRYVIETPLTQTTALSYQLKIISNCSWDIVVDDAIIKWVTLSKKTHNITGDDGFSQNDETTTVTVTVQPNIKIPSYDNNTQTYEYPAARSGKITIQYRGKNKGEGKTMLLNQQVIEIYQGGYVQIGEDQWLDRNLKTGWSYSNNYYPLAYPYANPIGLKTSIYGAYAINNNKLGSIISSDGSHEFGDDGYFVSGAPQSGYTFQSSKLYYRRNGYEYEIDYNDFDYPTNRDVEYSDNIWKINPCPPGWKVPTNTQLKNLANVMNAGTTYGRPIIFPYTSKPDITCATGAMGVKNSGRMIYVSSNGYEVPFFLPAADARHINSITISFAGGIGYYKQRDRLALKKDEAFNRQTNHALMISPSTVELVPLNNKEAASIRCVREKK